MIKSINKIKSKGFTIVELLVVIVVIGILAAITIVSYNGITTRARSTQIVTLANMVSDKAEAFAADAKVSGANPLVAGQGYYPSTASAFMALPKTAVGGLGGAVTLNGATAAGTASAGSTTAYATVVTAFGVPTATNGDKTIMYIACSATADSDAATAFFIGYFDPLVGTAGSVVWKGSANVASTPANGATLPTATNCGITNISTK